jgi:WD40 repeat protein
MVGDSACKEEQRMEKERSKRGTMVRHLSTLMILLGLPPVAPNIVKAVAASPAPAGHPERYLSVALSSRGRIVAAGTSGNTVYVTDLSSGRESRIPPWDKDSPGWASGIRQLAISPNEQSLLIGDGDGTVSLWDLKSAREKYTWRGHGKVLACRCSNDGKHIWAAWADGIVQVRDSAQGKLLRKLQLPLNKSTMLALSPESGLALSGGTGQDIVLWDLRSGKKLRKISSGWTELTQIALSLDGLRALATSTKEVEVQVWETATGRCLCSVHPDKKMHDYSVGGDPLRAEFTASGRYVITTGGMGASLFLWEVATGRLVKPLEQWLYNTSIRPRADRLAISGDGNRVFACAASGIRGNWRTVWDCVSGALLHALEGTDDFETNVVQDYTFSQDGRCLLGLKGRRGMARVWDTLSGRLLGTYPGPWDAPDFEAVLACSPEGNRVLTTTLPCGGDDRQKQRKSYTLRLRDFRTRKVLQTFAGHQLPGQAAKFSPDGKHIVSESEDNGIKLWDVASGKLIRTFPSSHVSFSPDGKRALAFSCQGKEDTQRWNLGVWDLQLDKEVSRTEKVPGYFLGWLPCSRRVLFEDKNGKLLRLYDVRSFRLLRTFRAGWPDAWHRSAAAVSPSGRLLVTADHDGHIDAWDIATGKYVLSFVGKAPRTKVRNLTISPDGKWLVSGGGGHTLRRWDMATGREVGFYKEPQELPW